jgi:hypothetical protein
MYQANKAYIAFLLQLFQAFGIALFIYLLTWHIMLYGYIIFFFNSSENLKTTIIHYLLIQDSISFLQINELNIYERRHLFDVKLFFQSLNYLFLYITLYSVSVFLITKQYLKKITINLLWVSYLGLLPLAIMSSLILIFGFLPTFNHLHSFFFPPNSWIFPKDSTLIQLFPLDYFFQFALIYLLLLLSIFSLCFWLGKKKLH